MTDQQKDQIQSMRRQGLSYVKIGQALGISDNTVRSFCRRNRLGEPVKHTIPCQYCGKPVKIVSKQKPRKFCSDRCRAAWWNGHREAVNRRAFYNFICAHCGRELRPTAMPIASIAAINATSQTALERRFPHDAGLSSRLERYLAAMFQAKQMLSLGILTPEDYAKIDTKMAEKYDISSCSIYRQKAG